MFVQMCLGWYYVYYRVNFTIIDRNETTAIHYAYQIMFLIAETVLLFNMIFHFMEVFSHVHRNCVSFNKIPNDALTPKDGIPAQMKVPARFSNYPSIGIYITYYREPASMTRDALLAAIKIDYPSELLTVYICDDGRDAEKEEIVATIQQQHPNIKYISRSNNLHAKAGNLNHAFQSTSNDFVMILDGDFLVKPNIIHRLLPYFFQWNTSTGLYEVDRKLAFVQSPQRFHNLPSSDNDLFNQRNDFFMNFVMPGKEWANATPMIGTNNLISRNALQSVNYMATHSVGEDTATSIQLHAKRYKSYYVKETLATGLVCTVFHDHVGQQDRWSKGDWQILFSAHGPLTKPGLSVLQRILYFSMVFYRLSVIPAIQMDFAIYIFLAFDVTVMNVRDPLTYLTILFTSLCLDLGRRLLFSAGNPNTMRSISVTDLFEPVFKIYNVFALITAVCFNHKITFSFTEKRVETSQRKVSTKSSFSGTKISSNTIITFLTAEKEDEKEKEWNPVKASRINILPRAHIWKNIRAVWYSILICAFLPPIICRSVTSILKRLASGEMDMSGLSPIYFLALGYSIWMVVPHGIALYKCFVPYVSTESSDTQNGRRFLSSGSQGGRFFPLSAISILGTVRVLIVGGFMVISLLFSTSLSMYDK